MCVIYTNVHNFAYNQDYYLFKSLKIIILLLQRYKAMACECPSPELFEPVKKHLLHYSKPQDTEAWKALGVSALYVLVVIYLNVSGHPFLGWSFQGLVTVRLFVQFHDMAHYSFFSSVSLNRLVGTLLGILVHFPFDAWRNGHNHHHKVFGNIDRLDLSQTILFTKKQYEEMPRTKRMLVRIFREPVIFFLISAPFIWFFALYFHIAKRYGILSQPFAEKVLSMVFVCVICPLVGISPLGMFLSTYLADVIGTALFHLQHSVNLPYRERKQKWDFTRAALEGSTFLDIPAVLKPIVNGIEYHHIHHLNTNVPSYAIRACHEDFEKGEKSQSWTDFHINQVDYWTSFKSMFNVMLDEEKRQLVPFHYGL